MTESTETEAPTFDSASRTATGPREANQDASLVAPGWMVIADGVGGGPAGWEAARLTCDAAGRRLRQMSTRAAARLHLAFNDAHRSLEAHVATVPTDRGMATTLSMALPLRQTETGASVLLGWVGDSPAWQYRGATRTIEQVGGDARRPGGSLSGWVSDGGATEPRFTTIELDARDWLILATDGMEVLDPATIADHLTALPRRLQPADVSNALIGAARRAGLVDNTTVAAARISVGRPLAPTVPIWNHTWGPRPSARAVLDVPSRSIGGSTRADASTDEDGGRARGGDHHG